MTGILLSPGPVVTRKAARGTSRAFLHGLSKAKFNLASTRLQAANLGELIREQRIDIFIKRAPDEAAAILNLKENADLCTAVEFSEKYQMPSPAAISEKMQTMLVEKGYVPREHFIPRVDQFEIYKSEFSLD